MTIEFEAMKLEFESIHKKKNWELRDLFKGRKEIAVNWICKVKHNANGTLGCFKAIFVAKDVPKKRG